VMVLVTLLFLQKFGKNQTTQKVNMRG